MNRRLTLSLILLATLLAAMSTAAKAKDKVEFDGLIEKLPVSGLVGDWTVSGRAVHVTATTHIAQQHGIVAAIDVFVEVRGSLLADGSINATDIDVQAGPGAVHEAKFSGFVDGLPASGLIGDWMVRGRSVHVSNATDVKMEHGLVAVNAFIEVKGFLEESGSVIADDITVEASPGDSRNFDFEGFVEKLPASGLVGDWAVEGRAVHVAATTEVELDRGGVVVNAFVKIKGMLLADGSISGSEVEVKASPSSAQQFDFLGFVDKLPDGTLVGNWIVSGKTVQVATDVRVKQEHGLAAENALVKVKGQLLADGSVKAVEVTVEASPKRSGRVKLQGFVDKLPAGGLIGDWIISGRTTHVSIDTRVKQRNSLITLGSLVDVKGFLEADGTITAGKITLKF